MFSAGSNKICNYKGKQMVKSSQKVDTCASVTEKIKMDELVIKFIVIGMELSLTMFLSSQP